MPREGYNVVTIPENVHHRLAEAARSENRSMPQQIDHMLKTQYPGLSALENVTCKACGYTATFDPERNAAPKYCRSCGAPIPEAGRKKTWRR